MFKILSIGELYLDFTQTDNAQKSSEFIETINGSPAIVAVQSSVLGAKTFFIGKTSTDLFGKNIINQLNNYGIDTSAVIKDDTYSMPIHFKMTGEKGVKHNIIYNQENFYLNLNLDDNLKKIIDECDIIHFGSLMLNNENSRQQLIDILDYAKKSHKTITYDPNYREFFWSTKKEAITQMTEILSKVDVIKVSEEELKMLTGCDKFLQGIAILLQKGIRVVIVTQGKSGCIVSCRSGIQALPTYKVNTVDKCGAGDSFFGGFLFKIAEAEKHIIDISFNELVSFCDFANACASLCSTKTGLFSSMPSKEQIQNCMLTCEKL